jgi:hypothetical protein
MIIPSTNLRSPIHRFFMVSHLVIQYSRCNEISRSRCGLGRSCASSLARETFLLDTLRCDLWRNAGVLKRGIE